MYKILTKYSIITVSLIGLFLIFSPKVEAGLRLNKDLDIDPSKTVLSFSDAMHGTKKFVIKTLPSQEGTSKDFNFTFDYNDSEGGFDINIPGEPEESYTYSDNYFIDNSRDIRVIPSSIDYKMAYNNTIAKLSFFIKYYNTQKNLIKLIESTYHPTGYDFSLVYKSIDIDLKMVIPLKLKQSKFYESKEGTKHGVLSYRSKNPGDEIVDEAIASIKVTPKGIVFDNGLHKITEDSQSTPTGATMSSTTMASNITINGNTATITLPKTPDKEFSGHGIRSPKKTEYKGVSTVTDLNEFIIGIANFILTFVAVICVLILTYGGYLWIIDRGEEQLAEKARKILAGAVIGLLIIISAYTIVNTVISLHSNNDSNIDITLDLKK